MNKEWIWPADHQRERERTIITASRRWSDEALHSSVDRQLDLQFVKGAEEEDEEGAVRKWVGFDLI
jgi:hypothetical protein